MHNQVETPITNQDISQKMVLASFLLALLVLVILYWPFLNGSKDYVLGDCQAVGQPLSLFLGDWLKKGVFPLWNPGCYCGYSQAAASSPSLFYPFNYILFLFPYSQGKALYLLLHQYMSGLAVFFLVERLLKSKQAALFGSMFTMFSGYLFALPKHTDFAASVCTLLFCLTASCLLFRASRAQLPAHFAGLTLCASLFFVSGRPEMYVPGVFLLFLFAVSELWQLFKSGLPLISLAELFVFWSLAFVCALLIACPMIAPSWEWIKLSPRALGLLPIQIFYWSACWSDWLAIVFFQPFGDTEMLRASAGTIQNIFQYANEALIPLFPAAFMGPAFFTTFCLGLLDKTFKPRYLLLLLCLCIAAICAGDQTPVAPFLLKLFPNLGVFRFPVKGLIFVLMLAILVSSAGLAWIMDRSKSPRRLYFFLAFWLCLTILGPALYYSGLFAAFISWLCACCKTTVLLSEYQIVQKDLLTSFLITGFCGSIFVLFACLYRRGYLRKNIAFAGLLTLALAPLAFNALVLKNEAAPGGYYEKPAALDSFLQKWTAEKDRPGEQFRLVQLLSGKLYMPESYRRATGEPYMLALTRFARDVLLWDLQFATGWNYANGYTMAETAQINHFFDMGFCQSSISPTLTDRSKTSDFTLARFCALTNSKYVIAEEQNISGIAALLDPALFTLVHTDSFLNVRIYQVRTFGSRFYFASKVETVGYWPTFAADLCSPANKRIPDDSITYLHSADLQYMKKPDSNGKPAFQNKTLLQIVREDPCRVELFYQKNKPGLLVMRDQFYPGWRVFIDGKEEPLLRANYINRAVFIEGGKHSVVFRFLPESLYTGYKLAGGGLAGAVIIFLVLYFRTRTKTKPDTISKLPENDSPDSSDNSGSPA